jgi:diguanylate cyclase (GGDEF)-like protein
MKKKIAVCANGWNYDMLLSALEGMKKQAQKEDFDTFVFLSFASYSEHVDLMRGELNIYELLNPADYDGVIVFSTSINSEELAVEICQKAKSLKVPVVSIGLDIDGIHSVKVNNETGMRELVEHLFDKHDIKRPFFIGGFPDHVDSIARLNVLKEACKERGIEFTDDNVAYGRWNNTDTDALIEELVKVWNGNYPDAIVCANDIMALATCSKLQEFGILAPQDIIVTGFDNLSEGKEFYPALSSVEQNYKEIAEKACDIIFDEINGDKTVKREMVESYFYCGESCGCKGEEDYSTARLLYCRHAYKRDTDARVLEQSERNIRKELTDMENYSELKATLREHYKNNHQFEGEGFYICVNKGFFNDVMISESELWAKGENREFEELVSLKNGEIVTGLNVDEHMIVPGYTKTPGETHVYFFMPMHSLQYNYGYVVLTDFPYIVNSNILYPYMEKLQQSIKLMRTNLRLKILYERDQMTGLYNRFGYEQKALPLYEESLEKKSSMLVMFVDINYMKHINDKFGHLHGDNAIKTVVSAINENVSNDSIAVRFGGDEFLVISPDCDDEKASKIRDSIRDRLDSINKEKINPYDISVSIGYVVTDPMKRQKSGLQDYIKEADKIMYEIKKEMHMRMDRRKR